MLKTLISFLIISNTQPLVPLKIDDIQITVEIADTQEKRQKGLMYRRYMPENQGMLFIMPKKQIVNMWMKNTYIPLDMLFMDENFTIKHIVKNTKINSEETISSKYPVNYVLELNAGFVDRHNITLNSKIK